MVVLLLIISFCYRKYTCTQKEDYNFSISGIPAISMWLSISGIPTTIIWLSYVLFKNPLNIVTCTSLSCLQIAGALSEEGKSLEVVAQQAALAAKSMGKQSSCFLLCII